MKTEVSDIYELKNILENDENRVIVIYNPKNDTSETKKVNSHKIEECRIKLTQREKEVLKHIAAGESNTEIAKNLYISVHTAKAHVCNIMQKIGVKDRVKAAVFAVKNNLV